MPRGRKTIYVVQWTKPTGTADKRYLFQRPAVERQIERLSSLSCTDVRVFAGQLTDVSNEFVPAHYDAAAVERRREWARGNRWRTQLLATNPQRVEWLMAHPRADRMMGIVGPTGDVLKALAPFPVRRRRRRR
jgi:hypothetical protein